MIQLQSLLKESTENKGPSPKLATFLWKRHVIDLPDIRLYHGTPLKGLKSMLSSGIGGYQHGEIAEHESFSTSFNYEVLSMFSDGDGITGLEFHAKGIKLLVMNDVVAWLATREAGSGIDLEVDNTLLAKYVKAFQIPTSRFNGDQPAFSYGYLSSLGVDAVAYEYVWKNLQVHGGNHRDENEICFIGKGIDKLNHCISEIYIEGDSFDSKEEALQILADVEET